MKTPKEIYEWMDKKIKSESVIGYKDEQDFWLSAKMFIGCFDQIERERDIAIDQLKQLGYSLGEKIKEECKDEETD